MSVIRLLRHRAFFPTAILSFLFFQFYFFNRYDSKEKLIEAYSRAQQAHTAPSQAVNPSKIYINDKSYIATPYEKLIETHGDAFHELSYDDKCKAYFDALYKTDSSWEVHDFSKLPFDRSIFETKKSFIQNKVNQYKAKLNPNLSNQEREDIIKHEQLEQLYEVEYQKSIKDAQVLEQRLIDSNTHLRVYGACFLDQYGPFTSKFNKHFGDGEDIASLHEKFLCHDVEVRMFQWLTQQYPTFTRWDGEVVAGAFPIMENYSNEIEEKIVEKKINHEHVKRDQAIQDEPVRHGDHSCFLKQYRDTLNGKGYVISAADSHATQLASLIGSFRALGNKLPIQVVHQGDLTKEVIEGLIDISRNINGLNFRRIANFESVLQHRNIVLKDPFAPTFEEIELIFPPQEIWFVDISKSVSKKYKGKFGGYGNKLLAYFFNSFQHAILMDTDTVPMVDFDEMILGSKFYKQQGAHFFRDRELFTQIKSTDSIFYQKLMPSIMDTAIFGIPTITDFTLGNRFISQRFDHYMESGVVAIDRIKHFTGVLATVQLQLWNPVTSRVWGDKELFWLALSMVGDENYFMNHWAAGAVGQITPQHYRLGDDADDSRRSKLQGNELCSTHPAHVSSEDNSTLLWFNSGFTYCKHKGSAARDIKTPLFNKWFQGSKTKLSSFYQNYHKIESVIIPKGAEYFVKNTGSGENERGWIKGTQCDKFLYCAYDKVGGRNLEESNGLLINFDEQKRKLYDFYGSVNENAIEIFQKN